MTAGMFQTDESPHPPYHSCTFVWTPVVHMYIYQNILKSSSLFIYFTCRTRLLMCVWMAPFHSKWVIQWSRQMYMKCCFLMRCRLCLRLTPMSRKIQHLIQLNDHLSLSKYETVCHSFQNTASEWSRHFVTLSSKRMIRCFHSNNQIHCLVQRDTYNWSSEYEYSTALAGSHLTFIQSCTLCA